MSRVENITLNHLSPLEVMDAVDRSIGRTDKVHDEFHDLGDVQSGMLVYEQYFGRVSNRIALVLFVENYTGQTRVRIISTGSSQGLIFNIDWGAASAYVNEVINILQRADNRKMT